jgi:hypothetical protein
LIIILDDLSNILYAYLRRNSKIVSAGKNICRVNFELRNSAS